VPVRKVRLLNGFRPGGVRVTGESNWSARVLGARRRAVTVMAVALLMLNLLDALFTSVYLKAGVATELNPIMRTAWEGAPVVFWLLKLGLASIGVFLLTRLRRWVAGLSLQACLVIYAMVVAYHLLFAARYFQGSF